MPTISGRRGAPTVVSHPRDSDLITGQKPDEDCAVVGYTGTKQAFPYLLIGLRTLQHRGQESAGIATYDGSMMRVKKGMGLVSEVFRENDSNFQDRLPGSTGIGHTRYSTHGSKNLENAGPFTISNSIGYIAISHNGEITNADQLREEMKKKGTGFVTSSDTEVMLMQISRDIIEFGINGGFRNSVSKLKGAYAAAIMINSTLYAFRDPYGIRPLVLGQVDDSYLVASESCVFDVLGGKVIRDVKPGELIEITSSGFKTVFIARAPSVSHCMFEYVYFARPDSIIDGREVSTARINIGRRLAIEHPVPADIVIPVPDSGRSQALGYSIESGIPYGEGLIKNRYSERTFIMPTQAQRAAAVRLKLNAIKSVIYDKRIVLVEDSIVRGNTIKFVIQILRSQGAREVHVRVGSPPIISPCYYGVDMKTKSEFLARGKSIEEIREDIGADSLGYISIDGLVESIGFGKNELCLGCLTGAYPVPIPSPHYPSQPELETYQNP